MNKLFTIILTLAALLAVAATPALADDCQPIYGGGENCQQRGNVVINKTVQHPQNGAFVDNLGVNDPKFGPDSTVTFQLTVTNNGGTDVDKATVKDIFPQFISFNAGPGSFDAGSKTLTFDVFNLKAGESRTFTLTGKVSSINNLPDNTSCVVNQGFVSANDITNQDNAQLCVAKVPSVTTKGGPQVFPIPNVTTIPTTGPEAIPMALMGISGTIGYFIKKHSR